eukprot:3277449-Amphidinium_carterae.1
MASLLLCVFRWGGAWGASACFEAPSTETSPQRCPQQPARNASQTRPHVLYRFSATSPEM